jgi:hypothetical protein
MTARNPELLHALKAKFGKVRISSQGCAAQTAQRTSWEKLPTQAGMIVDPPEVRLTNWGETYATCCPKCNDKRFRLYIGHMWGVKCSLNGSTFYPIKCHNENCDWRELKNTLFDDNAKPYITDSMLEPAEPVRRMELPCDPEDLIPINKLDTTHPAIQYLHGRGFTNLDLLAEEYEFCYCRRSPWSRKIKDSGGNWHEVTPANRLIIPNIQQGKWFGWQSRYIGSIPNDPTTGKPVIQKYLNAPGYSFGATVYSVDRAAEFTQGKFCVVCEGALSAIACGPSGVCTFGMFPKPMQEDILADRFSQGVLVFLIEHEAKLNGKIYSIIERLKTRVKNGCIVVDLPPGMDAANMGSDDLFELISKGSSNAGRGKSN